MPVSPTYPGVYVEEIPGHAHPISGVSGTTLSLLEAIAARVRNGGLGTRILITGHDKNAKVAAARVLARDLQLGLYRVDLSTIANKYIGETEKNLGRLFDAAERDGAILFFDEADALFGRRSEVKDSHDRYADIEVACLLQRIEEFEGLVILATSSKTSLDPAFLRRCHCIISLPLRSTNRPRKTKSRRSKDD